MNYKPIFEKISQEAGIPENVVSLAYKTFWKFIRKTITELPLRENFTEKEFNELRTCFNVPSLGKLVCTYDRYLGMKKRFKYLNNLKSRSNA